jgi:metal-responsive CopG/Arc/MetJ family transcriptional regulator
MAEPKQIFVNTPVDPDLLEKLDAMVEENESTRAQYIRLLIKKQWEERKRDEAGKKNYSRKLSATKESNKYPTKDLSPS